MVVRKFVTLLPRPEKDHGPKIKAAGQAHVRLGAGPGPLPVSRCT